MPEEVDKEREINYLISLVRSRKREGANYDQIRKEAEFFKNPVLIEDAILKVKEMEDEMVIHIEIPSITNGPPYRWYDGPREGDKYWPAYKKLLKVENEFPDEVIKSIDDATNQIISYLRPPYGSSFNIKGLVIGYVQSGKTANYMGVIAKAADLGYKLFIILTSSNNKLRRQTQTRVESDLVSSHKSDWHLLTSKKADFRAHITDPDSKLCKGLDAAGKIIRDDYRTICIVKKNTYRLRNLLDWLNRATKINLDLTSVLLIDDEADQASINTGRGDERTVINQRINDIIATLNKVAYIGYTASPFANVLINPNLDDLYPRDFILALLRPARYYGAEKIFGRELLRFDNKPEDPFLMPDPSNEANMIELFEPGLDVIRKVPIEEIPLLKPMVRDEKDKFEPQITDSLKRAIRYFWLATAARHYRGQSQKHSTMLVHTTSYSAPQNKFEKPLIDFRHKSQILLIDPDTRDEEIAIYKEIWEKELTKLDSTTLDPPLIPTSFEDLLPHLRDVIKTTQVFIENSTITREDRLVYGKEPGIFIVVGGNILSRGLTLEGLVVSFFIRSSSAYDTLLQMGRWFGFRIGYEDLPRIWMTKELKGHFLDLATVEEEIRYDIRRYMEDPTMTPLTFRVRIRRHPILLITSQLKMKHGVTCDISFSEKRAQTIIFKIKDRTWLNGNIRSVENLFKNIGKEPEKGKLGYNNACWGLEDVDVEHILNFIDEYTFHEKSSHLKRNYLKKYIQEENTRNSLLRWNIIVMSKMNNKEGEIPSIDFRFPSGNKINLVSRSAAFIDDDDNANLKSIMLRDDTILDLKGEEIDKIRKENGKLFEFRTSKLPETGLLVIYPIDKNSKPPVFRNRKKEIIVPNRPLEAKENVIGVGFVFPESKIPRGENYVTATPYIPAEIEIEDEIVVDDDYE